MKYLYLYPIEGLYNEFFSADPTKLNNEINVKENILDVNGYFWNKVLDRENITRLVENLKLYAKSQIDISPQYTAIISNTKKFIESVEKAKFLICDQGISQQEFFTYLETINISIQLWNQFSDYKNFNLSIQDGYIMDDYSYKNLNDKCLIKNQNPYLNLILEKVLPVIEDYNPNILFIVGKLSYYNVAIAKLLKYSNRKIKICVTRHSSEYYSLNKNVKCLLKNTLLFSDIDYLILEYFDYTEKKLVSQQYDSISEVPNIVYKDETNSIIQTNTFFPSSEINYRLIRKAYFNEKFKISPKKVADIHIAPYSKCYWNKCTFCGINKKYSHDYYKCDNDDFYNNIKSIISSLKGIKYLWFIDEALSIEQLDAISRCLLENDTKIIWQARTRIDECLLDNNLPKRLYDAGLRELRLGLESASLHVLKLMNKFNENFSLEIVKDIVRQYTKEGICIHFPIIIGFPGETDQDRLLTYNFLKEITLNNDKVTFNINILNLDTSSFLFKNWHEFSINSVSLPCLPEHFIGNTANWEGAKTDFLKLENERNAFMRSELYKWYPTNAITKPVVYYRLIESIRNTLTTKLSDEILTNGYPLNCKYILTKDITVSFLKTNLYLVYNWHTHHYFKCNKGILKAILVWKKAHTIHDWNNLIVSSEEHSHSKEDLKIILDKLITDGYLIEAK